MSFLDYRDYPQLIGLVDALKSDYRFLAQEACSAIEHFSPSPERYVMDAVRLFILPAIWQRKRIGDAALEAGDYRDWQPDASAEVMAFHTRYLVARLDSPLVVSAMYSCSVPGCELVPHIDRVSAIGDVLRLHLGLDCPQDGCGLIVAGEERQWVDGEVLLFDSACVEHSAYNRSERPRMILIVDLDRAMLNPCSE